MSRPLRAAAVVFVLTLAPAAAASAHVVIVPGSAPQGAYTTLTFQVPNERPDASTVRVDIFMPAGTPIASVQAPGHPGWPATVKKTPLAKPIEARGRRVGEGVSEIDWAAGSDAAAIGPGATEAFKVTLGPLPKTDRAVFKALQYYSDGTVVRWIQEPVRDADRPAAVLTLTGGARTNGSGGGGGGSSSLPWAILAGVLVLAMAAGVLLARRRR